MAFREFVTTCRFTAVAGGLANFAVSAAVAGYLTPTLALAQDGKVYHYYAQSADGEVWEEGFGAWTLSSTTIARTTIFQNSAGTTEKINFAAAPTVVLFPSPLKLEVDLVSLIAPTGTAMVFYQASAPVGWTKQTTHNDKSLRVVSGTGGGSGGSVAFSTLFGRTTVDSLAISITQMPSHTHGYLDRFLVGTAGADPDAGAFTQQDNARATDATGGGASHTHGLDMRVHYLDVLICTKDAIP